MPESWAWTTLGEISNYGETKNVLVDKIPSDNWVLELEDIESYTAILLQKVQKSERKIKGGRYEFHQGNLLYSKLRTYLNKVLVADSDGFCSTEIIPIDFLCDISSSFFCYVLRSDYFLDYTAMCVYGDRMPRLSTTDARKACLPLPPLAEQYRIASEVERLFALIDEIEEDKASLEEAIKQAKRKVLELAVTGKLCDDNRHYEKSAQTTILGNLCKLVDGSKIMNKKMPYLDVKFLRGKSEAHLLSEGQFVPKGTNMILVDGENSGEIFTAPIDGYKGSTFKLLSFDSSVNTKFILLFIRANQSKFKESKVGSAIPHLNKKLFKSLEIALPSFEEQEVVVNRVNTINNALDEIALHTI